MSGQAIVPRIEQARADAMRVSGYVPTGIYLGVQEWDQLRSEIRSGDCFMVATLSPEPGKILGTTRTWFRGLEIFVVSRDHGDSHFAVVHSRQHKGLDHANTFRLRD